MKLVESLRDGNPKVRELEREMEKLEDSLHDEKAQVAKLQEVCFRIYARAQKRKMLFLNVTSLLNLTLVIL